MTKNQSSKIAENNYQVKHYSSNNPLEKGLAITHEQVSDTYTEGTLEAKIENVNGQDIEIPQKGYEG